MFNKLKRIANTDEKKRLFSNFFSLGILQAANYILPLITFPYLVRVLGIDYFGVLAFATALITYFSILTDYGFNLTATREVSKHRKNRNKLIEIFSSVMIIKLFLLLLSLLILTILLFCFQKLQEYTIIYLLTFGTVVGQTFFPIWFFQGMERMKYITYISLVTKFIFTIAIFCFIQKQEDFYFVPLLNSIGILIGGVYSLYLIKKDFNVHFQLQRIDVLKTYLIDGWHIFVSTFGVNLYKNNAILVLGIFMSESAVGIFAIAKKVIDILNQIAGVISRTIFPYVVNKYEVNKFLFRFLFKLAGMIFSYTFVIFLLLFFYANELSLLISGVIHTEFVESIQMMSIVPLLIAMNIPAVQVLLLAKKDNYFSRAVLVGGLLDLCILFSFIPYYGFLGAAATVVITEFFVTVLLYYYAVKLIQGKI